MLANLPIRLLAGICMISGVSLGFSQPPERDTKFHHSQGKDELQHDSSDQRPSAAAASTAPQGAGGRRWIRRVAWGFAIVVVLLFGVGPFLDRVVFPEAAPGPELVPQVGQVFHSDTEGFTQRVLKRENGLIWAELTLHPHAAGPPAHIHRTFTERFHVERGTVSLLVGTEFRQLHAGEDFTVAPGITHKPFNPTDEEAVVLGPLTPEYALPERFGIFLSQAYGFFDEAPENGRPPRAILQMSRFSPVFDSWLGQGPPVGLQRVAFWIIGPIARLMGYRTYYSKYAPERVAVKQS